MTTRWFVEVSRVDADTQKERYCVEALQWQQALQQARKLRGDRGALSRFAIELLESGYRATDPGSRLRYTINKAPHDAPLSGNTPSNGAKVGSVISLTPTAPPGLASPAVSEPPRPSLPRPPTGSAAPNSTSAPPKVSAAPASTARPSGTPEVPRRNSANIATSPAIPKPRRSQRPPKVQVKKSGSVEPPAVATGSDSAAPSVESPTAAPSVEPPAVALSPESSIAAAAPSLEPPAVTPTTELTELDPLTSPPPETAPSVPGLELVTMRREEPTEAVPITYREYSFAIAEGTEPEALERHARDAWEQVRAAIGHVTSQKFVQIALFDHRFEGRPLRPPVAVLVWKDWRGDPVLQLRGGSVPATSVFPPASLRPATQNAEAPASFPAPNAPASFPAAPAAPASAAPVAPASFPSPAAPPPAPPAPEAPAVHAAAPVPVDPAPLPSEPKRTKTPSRPGSSPGVSSRKRRSSEDLIGELFEEMHQLLFMPDMVAGAEYVLGVMLKIMPCEGILIHVFDINTRQFVVVRASGPNSRAVLLHRTPDTFRLFRDVFRRSSALAIADASADANFKGGRWEGLGVTVKSALCGAVKQGGRYLGVIELANAAGGAPFQVTDVNALDYICGQFADFVASKPLVIDDDAVLPRT